MSNACLRGFPVLRHLLTGNPFLQTVPSSLIRNGPCHATFPLANKPICWPHNLFSTCSRATSQAPRTPSSNFTTRSPQRPFHNVTPRLARRRHRFSPTPPEASPLPARRQQPHDLPNLPETEVKKVFALPDLSPQTGNAILRLLQRRRQTGSLLERGVQLDAKHAYIPQESLRKALEWLREKYPLDEQAAGQEWAEQAARKLELQYIARGEQLGLYKPLEKTGGEIGDGKGRSGKRREAFAVEDAVVRTGKTYGSDPRESLFENLKKVGDRRRKQEAKAEAAAEKQAALGEGKAGDLQTIGNSGKGLVAGSATQSRQLKQAEFEQKQAAKLQKNTEWVEHYRRLASGSSSTDVPRMTKWQRLAPSTFVAVSLVIISILATQFYEPPIQEDRLFPDIPPFYLTLGAITAINVGICALWHFPPAWRLLNKYFVCVPSKPIAVSVFGNLFSHQSFGHLFSNMCALWVYGYELHDYVGRANFVAIYTSGGLVGALLSLWMSVFRGVWNHWHFGASGCTYAVMVAWVTIQSTLPLNREDPWSYTADVGRYAFAAISVLQHFTRKAMVEWDNVAHAGGAVIGYVWAEVLKFRSNLALKEG